MLRFAFWGAPPAITVNSSLDEANLEVWESVRRNAAARGDLGNRQGSPGLGNITVKTEKGSLDLRRIWKVEAVGLDN